MKDLVAAFDVGGTNTRARVAAVTGLDAPVPVMDDVSRQVTTARGLYDFVTEVTGSLSGHGAVVAAVVAVAGPVTGDRSVVTNWSLDAAIERAELERAGLPSGRTRLVNDMVAGAWGAFARSTGGLQPLSAAASGGGPRDGTIVFVVPGTGLGAASLVRHGLGRFGASVLACESQHAQIPRFAGEIGQVIDAIAEADGRAPSWEEIVSGRGLVRTYDAVCAIEAREPLGAARGEAERAQAIGDAARSGDASARAAIDVYYAALGHFLQMLALSLLPCGAVIIGGASTEANSALLRSSSLTAIFGENPRMGELLGRIPLYTIGGPVNLEGGIWLASRG